jgi:hypothetical protein
MHQLAFALHHLRHVSDKLLHRRTHAVTVWRVAGAADAGEIVLGVFQHVSVLAFV